MPPREVMPTYLYWVSERTLGLLDCGEFVSQEGQTPSQFIVPEESPAWRLPEVLADPKVLNGFAYATRDRVAGGKVIFDLNARGVRASTLLIPFSARNGADIPSSYPASQPPSGEELAHFIEATVCDGQVAARVSVDVLPFVHGARKQNIGYTHVGEYDRDTGETKWFKQDIFACPNSPAIFENAVWHIGGNIAYAQTTEYPAAFGANDYDTQASTRDYFVCRYRLSLGETQRLVQRSGFMHTRPNGSSTDEKFVRDYGVFYVPQQVCLRTEFALFSTGEEVVSFQHHVIVGHNPKWEYFGPVGTVGVGAPGAIVSYRYENSQHETIYNIMDRPSGSGRGVDLPYATPVPVSMSPFWDNVPLSLDSARHPALRLVVDIDEDASGESNKNTVLATAYSDREEDGSNWRNGHGVGPEYSPLRSVHAVGGFSDVGIVGMNATFGVGTQPGSFGSDWRGTLKVFRDGVFVTQFANVLPVGDFFYGFRFSPIAGLFAATGEEGVYLLQFEPDDDTGKPPFVLGSFVVDKTPPLVVVSQINDMYVGDASKSLAVTPRRRAAACSEPSDSFRTVHGFAGSYPNFSLGFIYFDPMPTEPGEYSWTADQSGEYAITPDGQVYDRAGNASLHKPELRLKVHEVPEGGLLGAHACIGMPESADVRGGVRAEATFMQSFLFSNISHDEAGLRLFYENPIKEFTVFFDRPVRDFEKRHILLERVSGVNGEKSTFPPSEIEVTKRSSTEWAVKFPNDYRNCVWYAKFDPVATGKIVRVARNDGVIEECRLAARAMWGVLPTPRILEPIDCTNQVAQLGGVSSVTEEIEVDVRGTEAVEEEEESGPVGFDTPEDKPKKKEYTDLFRGYRDVSLSTSAEMYLPPSAGEFSSDKSRRSFIPNVPKKRFDGTGVTGAHGYFGIPTTIYPAPPGLVAECAAPSAPQKHSSLICSENEITSWTIEQNRKPSAPSAMSFSSQYRGFDCQQNVWADENYYAFLYVTRNASVYNAQQTAFLHRLTIHIRGFQRGYEKILNNVEYPPSDGRGRRALLKLLPENWEREYLSVWPYGEKAEWWYPNDGMALLFNPPGWPGGVLTKTAFQNFSLIPFELGPYELSTEDEEALAAGETVELKGFFKMYEVTNGFISFRAS